METLENSSYQKKFALLIAGLLSPLGIKIISGFVIGFFAGSADLAAGLLGIALVMLWLFLNHMVATTYQTTFALRPIALLMAILASVSLFSAQWITMSGRNAHFHSLAFNSITDLLIIPLYEELFFRRALLSMLSNRIQNRILLALIGALVFSLAHLNFSSIYLARYGILGFLWASTYINSNFIIIPSIMHVANNFMAISLF